MVLGSMTLAESIDQPLTPVSAIAMRRTAKDRDLRRQVLAVAMQSCRQKVNKPATRRRSFFYLPLSLDFRLGHSAQFARAARPNGDLGKTPHDQEDL